LLRACAVRGRFASKLLAHKLALEKYRWTTSHRAAVRYRDSRCCARRSPRRATTTLHIIFAVLMLQAAHGAFSGEISQRTRAPASRFKSASNGSMPRARVPSPLRCHCGAPRNVERSSDMVAVGSRVAPRVAYQRNLPTTFYRRPSRRIGSKRHLLRMQHRTADLARRAGGDLQSINIDVALGMRHACAAARHNAACG